MLVTAAPVAKLHTVVPVVSDTQYTLLSLLPKYISPDELMTGDDWMTPVGTAVHCVVTSGPGGPLYADTPVCCGLRPNCPHTCDAGVGDTDGVLVTVRVTVDVGVSVTDPVLDDVSDTDPVLVRVRVSVAVPDGDAVTLAVSEAVTVDVADTDGVAVLVSDAVALVVLVSVAVAVAVDDAVALSVAVAL